MAQNPIFGVNVVGRTSFQVSTFHVPSVPKIQFRQPSIGGDSPLSAPPNNGPHDVTPSCSGHSLVTTWPGWPGCLVCPVVRIPPPGNPLGDLGGSRQGIPLGDPPRGLGLGGAVSTLFCRSGQNDPKWPFQHIPKWSQNSFRTTPNIPQKTRHHTPRQPRHDTHLHSGHGVGKCAPRWTGGGRSGGEFSHPMAAVEVCVAAWLASGVVAGLLGVAWDGSGAGSA